MKRFFQRLLSALALFPALIESGCFSAHYVGQQAIGQLHLLQIRRRVSEVIDDPSTGTLVRERLRLAMEARQFGIDVLGMRGGAEFTRYVDTGGPVAYNLTAADPTTLRLRRWKFPLVGRVPYLGFFKQRDALEVVKYLEKSGFDTYVRPVSGYSTLGYFISPIYAAMLEPQEPTERGAVRTVEVVLHEMAHSTAYIKSASELNESYATLVGIEGAARFFRERGDGVGSELVRQLANDEERQHRAFSAWFEPALKIAENFYAQAQKNGWSREQILKAREEMFQQIQASYRAAFPKGPHYRRLAQGPLNNAVLMSFGVYHQSSDMQQMLLASVGGDLKLFIDLYKLAEGRSDGATWLEERAAEQRKAVH